MKVTFLFNELTVPSAGYVPRNRVPSRLPSGLSASSPASLSLLLSIAAREKEYNVADRPENYKFSRRGVSFQPNSSRTLGRVAREMGHDGFFRTPASRIIYT